MLRESREASFCRLREIFRPSIQACFPFRPNRDEQGFPPSIIAIQQPTIPSIPRRCFFVYAIRDSRVIQAHGPNQGLSRTKPGPMLTTAITSFDSLYNFRPDMVANSPTINLASLFNLIWIHHYNETPLDSLFFYYGDGVAYHPLPSSVHIPLTTLQMAFSTDLASRVLIRDRFICLSPQKPVCLRERA